MPAVNVDQEHVKAIYDRETERFHNNRPKSATLLNKAKRYMPNGVPCAWMDGLYFHQPIFATRGEGAYFWDVDGYKYLDMNQADLSMNCGYGPQSLVGAVQQQQQLGHAVGQLRSRRDRFARAPGGNQCGAVLARREVARSGRS